MCAALTASIVLSGGEAHANNFSSIAKNITTSVADVPGLLTGLAYLFGILIGVLGILKIKDHVENPQQTPLKDGAIRLAAGGGLFALPIVYESMFETVGNGGAGVKAALLQQVQFNVG
jgi:hypothetical protein